MGFGIGICDWREYSLVDDRGDDVAGMVAGIAVIDPTYPAAVPGLSISSAASSPSNSSARANAAWRQMLTLNADSTNSAGSAQGQALPQQRAGQYPQRLMEPRGYLPPAEYEEEYHRAQTDQAAGAGNSPSLR